MILLKNSYTTWTKCGDMCNMYIPWKNNSIYYFSVQESDLKVKKPTSGPSLERTTGKVSCSKTFVLQVIHFTQIVVKVKGIRSTVNIGEGICSSGEPLLVVIRNKGD